jgi:putative sigma-54 modulation protein
MGPSQTLDMRVTTGSGTQGDDARVDIPVRRFSFELHSPDLRLSHHLGELVETKVRTKFAKFQRRITDVVVHLRDVNGTKGGADKSCHIEVRISGLEPVNVQDSHEDLQAAIELAVGRMEEAVHRHIDRVRTKPREQGRKLVRHHKLAD